MNYPPTPVALHVFDVCGTLFIEDTTAGLLIWHFRRRRARTKMVALQLIFSRHSPLNFVLRAVELLTRRHLAKRFAVGLLAGEQMAELNASAQQYAGHLVEAKRIFPVFDRLLAQRGRSRVVLASASLEPIIAALCQRLEVQGVGSRLEVSSGLLTGRLSNDLTGRKIDALVEVFGGDFFEGRTYGYSDNPSDGDLLEKCTHRVVVLHRPRDRSRWELEDAHYLHLFAREDLPETAS